MSPQNTLTPVAVRAQALNRGWKSLGLALQARCTDRPPAGRSRQAAARHAHALNTRRVPA